MQCLWWILAILASACGCLKNTGINIRLSQRGLSYAAQKAADDLYDKFRNEKIPDFNDNSRRFRASFTNIQIPQLSRPTFNLQINPGQGVSAILHLNSIKATGNFRVRYKLGWFWISKSGTFTATAAQSHVNIALGVGKDATGRPTVTVQSCSSNIGSFSIDIHSSGLLGWIIGRFEGFLGREIKKEIAPKLCQEVRKLVSGKLTEKLKELKVTTKLQDDRLLLDYSLLHAPMFSASYIDTIIKGDIAWKGNTTGTSPSLRTWPSVPGSSNRMATIYITDYIMNALGTLLHNDGSLSYNVTRAEVSSSIRSQLVLTCSSNAFCAGSLFPDLAAQYPDGWLEAGLRTEYPPRLIIGNNVVKGNFSGILEVYVKRPNGQKTRVATATAQMLIPLSLTISGNMIKAAVGTPTISMTLNNAQTDGLKQFLTLIEKGFAENKLNEIGQKGFELPSFKNAQLVNPQIYILPDIIAVSTDVNYTG